MALWHVFFSAGHRTVKCRYVLQEDVKAEPDARPEGGPVILNRNPTTSFLTATTLIYAIGAGITAAAGTRLAPQLILIKRCKFYSFQLQDMRVNGKLSGNQILLLRKSTIVL